MQSPTRCGQSPCCGSRDVSPARFVSPDDCARFAQLFTTMIQGVVYQDESGRIVAANPAAERILGLTFAQMAGRTPTDPCWKAIREDGSDFPDAEHPAMVALQGGQAVSDVLLGMFHPGQAQYRWLLVNAIPNFRPGESQPFEVFTTFTDITDFKRHENALLEAQQRLEAKKVLLQQVVDNLPQHLFWKSRDGTFRGCNDAGAQAFGLHSPDDIIGKSDCDLYANPADGDFFFEQDLNVMEKGTPFYHSLCQKQESCGEIKWLDVTKVPLRDAQGNVDGLLVSYEDVTNLSRVEESLRKFKQVVEQSPDTIIITDLDGNIEYVNPAFCHTYGYGAQEVLGHNPRFLKSARTSAGEWCELWDAIRAGQAWKGEFLNLKKDGSPTWQSATVSAIFDESGCITHFLSIQENIDARKLAEEALFNAMQLLQQVLDHIPQQVFWKDLNSVYFGGNTSYLATVGMASAAELKGKTDFDLHPTDHARKYRKDDRNVMRHDHPRTHYEEPMLALGGEIRWAQTSKVPLHNQDNEVIGVLGIFEDITERKAMQQKFADTLQQLQTILDNAQVGIAYFQKDKFLWINRRMEEVFGYKRKEICDKSPELLFPTAENHAQINALSSAVMAQGKPFEIEHILKRKNGRLFWCHMRGVAVDSRDLEKGSIWILLDIDSRKTAEQDLLELNNTLAQQVSKEIASGMEKEHLLIQQARHAAMGEMIGNIAHQWRQPLSVLGLILQNIGIDYEEHELTGDALRTYISEAMLAIRQMSGTIDDFRNFFSPNRQKTIFDLCQAIEETLALLSASLKNHNIKVKVRCTEKIEIRGHRNEFSQMLLNLIGNAKDALEEHGPQQAEIFIEAIRDRDHAVITIRDNAGGIPPDIVEKIFDPYFTTKEMGTGIGLYMTKTILEKHLHGTIVFRNCGEGAEFTMTLPLGKNQEKIQEAP